MKQLVLSAALALSASMAAVVTDYKSQVYGSIEAGDYERADSVLGVWRGNSPGDQELYPAEFNRYFNEARRSMVTIEGTDGIRDGALILTDSTGNQVGAIGETVEWNDSLYLRAIEVISAGIERYPSRLDFRLGKATAHGFRAEWPAVIETLENIINYNSNNGVVWTWEHGDTLAADTADVIVRQAMFENLTEIYESEDEMSPVYVDMLGNTILGAYPDEYRTLNMLGGNRFAQGDKAGAIDFFRRSYEANPTDGLSLSNIAYIYYNDKDTVKALEVCNKILDDPKIDERSKEIASDLLETINTPLTPIRPYDYFFKFLPFVGESVMNEKPGNALSDVHFANVEFLEYNRMVSPFADADIVATVVGEGKDAVFVWQFPEPKEMPLCLFVAFVPDGEGYSVYTIEKSLGDAWVMGASKGGDHSNYGAVDRPADAEDFVAKLRKAKLIR